MNATDFVVLLPLLVISTASLAVMIVGAFTRNHALTAALSVAGLAATFLSLGPAGSAVPRQVTPLLILDAYAFFYIGLMVVSAAAVVLLTYGYLQAQSINREECYLLLLLATLGSMVLASSSHFVSFFLGLEILSVSLYTLIAYLYPRKLPIEAGIKYLVLAASSSAFLLFGMALVYAELGTMEFAGMAKLLSGADPSLLLQAGLALLLTGVGFKLAVVPFHMWTPDVYEGAPAPVTAFVATVSKGGVFALLLRYFYGTHLTELAPVSTLFSIVAIASMIAGNLLALLQDNVKRILAYSSIAHFGYLLVAFQAGGEAGASAAAFYLVAYFITTLGAFGVVTVLSNAQRDADSIGEYRGLFWRRPVLAGVFTAMLLSLAGIPLTAGFLGKFYVVMAGASSHLWTLILVLVVTSAIGLFYYLRVLVALYAQPSEAAGPGFQPLSSVSGPAGLVLAVAVVLLIWFGVYPAPLLDWIAAATAGRI